MAAAKIVDFFGLVAVLDLFKGRLDGEESRKRPARCPPETQCGALIIVGLFGLIDASMLFRCIVNRPG